MSATPRFTVKALALLIGSTTLLACGEPSNRHGASVSNAAAGTIETVKVTFSRIDLKPAGSDAKPVSYEFDEPVTINNLLALSGKDAAPILEGADVPPGDYEWLRIYMEGGMPNSSVTLGQGDETDLYVSGAQYEEGSERFLQLDTGFTVAEDGHSNLTIDFVLRKGLSKPDDANYYLLRPAMRLLANTDSCYNPLSICNPEKSQA